MSRAFTVDDIINEIRSLTDEWNENQLDISDDILPSLRRAHEKAYQVLSRSYPEPIVTRRDLSGVTTLEYSLPENIWEDKIIRAEWVKSGTLLSPIQCQNVSLAHLGNRTNEGASVSAPSYYTIFDRTIRFSSVPNGSRDLRLWILREIEPPMIPYGRVTATSGTNTMYLTDVAKEFDPSGSTDNFDEYVNLIDGQTGKVKGTFQILSWDGADTLTIKGTPDRSSILNRDIDSSITGIAEADDYICHIKGSCVLYFMEAIHGFIVQYSAAELKRKLGYAYDVDQQLIKDFESDLKKAYMGRDTKMRVWHNNPNWMNRSRRFVRSGWR